MRVLLDISRISSSGVQRQEKKLITHQNLVSMLPTYIVLCEGYSY